jgi:hypothetical protein
MGTAAQPVASGIVYIEPMAKAPLHDDRHLKELRELCAQAEKLSKAADELCQRLTARIEATRTSLLLSAKPPVGERRRKPRKHR